MSLDDAYLKKMEAKLDEWGARLEVLRAKAESKGADAKIAYEKRVEALKSKAEAARRKLDELRGAGRDRWDQLKSDLERTWDDLRGSSHA